MYPEEQKLHDIELKVGLLNKDVEMTTDCVVNSLNQLQRFKS
jgi:hypothetical protein